MAKVRVHELAKELDISTKDLINFLVKNGIENKKTMSSLSDYEVKFAKENIIKNDKVRNNNYKNNFNNKSIQNKNIVKGRNKNIKPMNKINNNK